MPQRTQGNADTGTAGGRLPNLSDARAGRNEHGHTGQIEWRNKETGTLVEQFDADLPGTAHFIDHAHGGWFPEIDTAGAPTGRQFLGKPDIYHALQAELFPLAPGVARHAAGLAALPAPA